MFMVLSSWHSHCESSPGSFDECRLSVGWPPALRTNQPIWAVSPPKDWLLPSANTIAIYYYYSARKLILICVLKGRNGENGVRMCCDYRCFNKFTKGDAYPTPDISDIIHRVGKANWISSWDMRSGYYQLLVKPEHRWLTAFVTDFGTFSWTRMLFGLKCASNSFIRAVQQVLQPIQKFCDSYVDDSYIFWSLGSTLRTCSSVSNNYERGRLDIETGEMWFCKATSHICGPYHWIRKAWSWSKQSGLRRVHETFNHEKRSETAARFFFHVFLYLC